MPLAAPASCAACVCVGLARMAISRLHILPSPMCVAGVWLQEPVGRVELGLVVEEDHELAVSFLREVRVLDRLGPLMGFKSGVGCAALAGLAFPAGSTSK